MINRAISRLWKFRALRTGICKAHSHIHIYVCITHEFIHVCTFTQKHDAQGCNASNIVILTIRMLIQETLYYLLLDQCCLNMVQYNTMYKSLTFTSQPIFIQFETSMTVALKRTKGVGTFVLTMVVCEVCTFVIVYKRKDTRLN